MDFGINLVGQFSQITGMGEAVRGNYRAIRKVNIPCRAIDFKLENHDIEVTSYEDIELKSTANYSINLIQLGCEDIKELMLRKGAGFFEKKYNIAYLVWETEKIPEHFLEIIEVFDEVWTASSYCQKAFSDKVFKPVYRLPHVVDIDFLSNHSKRKPDQIPSNVFVFLNIFDYRSLIDRKNTLNLIKIFSDTFSHRKDVKLVLKSSPTEILPQDVQRVDKAITESSNIIHINQRLQKKEVVDLLKRCDSYISLHRSEGFGLSMADAMALGKPTIATAYSGNMEFMNMFNSILVPYTLTELNENIPHFEKGTVWAEANLNFVSNLMLDLVDYPQKYEHLSQNAMETVRKQLSPGAIGQRISHRVHRIEEMLKANSAN